MKQYKSERTLNNAVDKWFMDVVVNKLHFKGNIENEEEIKKFLKVKKIHVVSKTNPKYNTEAIILQHMNNNKIKYECNIDYVNLTLEVR